jgi:hypothetical protein
MGNIFPDTPVRPEGVRLEDHPDVALCGGNVDPEYGIGYGSIANYDFASVRIFETRNQAQ